MPRTDLTHAKLLQERGEIDAAFAVFSEALTADFNDHEALYRIGLGLAARGHYGLAANVLSRCAEAKPDAGTLQDLGYCYRATDQVETAEQIWRLAFDKAETNHKKSEILGNIAGCYSNNGTPEKGIDLYNQAIDLDPNNKHHHFNKGILQLELGIWGEGFANYELGFNTGQRTRRTYEGVKPWRPGMDVKGKTVIVWGEQGIGDEIMFASCIPDLMRDAKRVIFDCHPRLVTLFERSFGIKCYGTRKTTQADWWRDEKADISMSVTSLALIYRSNGQFPGTPYLRADPYKFPESGRPKIGISWTGGTVRNKLSTRSIPLPRWEPILRAIDADWYSLQYTEGAAKEVGALEEATGIHVKHFPGWVQCDDYGRTVDFTAGLDLVISVCTSILHVAGAIDKPCWLLTPTNPAWTVGLNSPRHPWYSTVDCYRQTVPGDWESVIDAVCARLTAEYGRRMAAE